MKTILIVDDSADLREAMRIAFEYSGYRVLEAGYLMGVEFMATHNSTVSVVILDGNVPWSDGQLPMSSIPLALLLHEYAVPLIFHSGDTELCREARKKGLTVVEKGSGMKELLEAVEGR